MLKDKLYKYKQVVMGAVIGLAIGAALTIPFSEAEGAGTSSDPLVTVSYMQDQMAQMKADILEQVGTAKDSEQTTSSQGTSLFEILNVEKDSKIYFGDSAEFILRVGSATVLDPNTVGIPDLTDGDKVMASEAVPIDHHMLVPSNDGRGIVVTADSWIMIKGTYTVIKN